MLVQGYLEGNGITIPYIDTELLKGKIINLDIEVIKKVESKDLSQVYKTAGILKNHNINPEEFQNSMREEWDLLNIEVIK